VSARLSHDRSLSQLYSPTVFVLLLRRLLQNQLIVARRNTLPLLASVYRRGQGQPYYVHALLARS
jgi:hypothetical protein